MALFGKKAGAGDPFGDDGDWWGYEEDGYGDERISRNRWLMYASTMILVLLAMFAGLVSLTIDEQRAPRISAMPTMAPHVDPEAERAAEMDRSAARRPWLTPDTDALDDPEAAPVLAVEPTPEPEPEPVSLPPRVRPAVLDRLPTGTPDLFVQAARTLPGERLTSLPVLRDPETPPLMADALAPPPPRLSSLPTDTSVYFDADAAAAAPNRVALVITGLGLSRASTEMAIDLLPPQVTLAFDPYANSLSTWVSRAQSAGHEVLVGLPAEGVGYPVNDPGPIALASQQPVELMGEELRAVITRSGGKVGGLVVNGRGFLAGSEEHIGAVIEAVNAGNLTLVQVGGGMFPKKAATHFVADARLDARPFRAAIDARLAFVEENALYRGQAVGVTAAGPAALERMVIWLDGLAGRGVGLVPLSSLTP